ncbi:glutamate receptor 1-like [Tigriopus californicus]|uniref:glutamate receptor 1-like n=1 Tax=Tigriopus californicus TaxID=6832 RepID=UPI0027D9DDEC|nr:glutamate receptor 1-like [Tigriopus californicus]
MAHFDLQQINVVNGPNCSRGLEVNWNRIVVQLSSRFFCKASPTKNLLPISHNQLIIYPCDQASDYFPRKVQDIFLIHPALSGTFPVFPGVDTSIFTFKLSNDSKEIHIHEHYKFLESDPVISNLYSKWDSENGFDLLGQDKHPLERRKNLHGRNLILSQALYWPFVFKRENGSFGGISLDVIHNFQQTMNFTYELVESPDGTYGTRQNQSWTGFVGQLINGSADVCIATLTITHSRRKVIDFSIPIMWTDLSVFIANPYDKVNFLTYFAPLTLANWIALLILLVLATLVLDWTDQQSLATEEKMEFGRFKAL